MKFQKLNQLLFLLMLSTVLCCNDKKAAIMSSNTMDSTQSISLETLNLIYDGPKNFTLDYFPKTTIRRARIKECVIIERDSVSSRAARKVMFDSVGNIARDENNFFSQWFEGTARGTYRYHYKGDRLVKMIGITEEDSRDSIMVVWNYDTMMLLYSKDVYQFARKLKYGADRHLPAPGDFEEYPTWSKLSTYRFLVSHDTILIKTIIDDEIVNQEKYQLFFDDLDRLTTVKEFQNSTLVKTIKYTYDLESISEFIETTTNEGAKLTHKSLVILSGEGLLMNRVTFKNDGTEKSRMVVTYDEDGLIKAITNGNVVQEFKYSYY